MSALSDIETSRVAADIVLLGHGSRRGPDTDYGLAEAVRRLQSRVDGNTRVRMAGFEFTRPSLREAIMGLVAEGSRRIVVVPYFLFNGKHIILEIPEDLEGIRNDAEGVEIIYAHTLGFDLRLMDLVKERVEEALTSAGVNDPGDPWGVVFVNRGSRPEFDPGLRLRQLALALDERLGPRALVRHAQAEYASPTIPEAATELVSQGCRVIVVMPYIFFPGKVLNDNIIPGMKRAEAEHAQTTFIVANTLGVDDRLVEAALDRAQEALASWIAR
ncbi:MAG: cobalamin biosynthesis protein CbiX [Dehalococcoidia bacterium]|nr:cobalamin biosynthesis protein CbiX [Dehalococcoidia bacterium]